MSASTAKTGRTGKAVVGSTLIARTQEWRVNKTLDTSTEWGDSDGAGFTNAAPGRKGATMQTNGKYDTSNEVYDLFQPEDYAILTLWMDNSSLYFDFPRALNNDFNIMVNIDTEEVIGWDASWRADGIFYYPGESGAPSRSLP